MSAIALLSMSTLENPCHAGQAIPLRQSSLPHLRTGTRALDSLLSPQTRYGDVADEWNKLDLGVKFKWVEKIEQASFLLSYAGNQGDVLAEAFFPNEDDLSYLNVYSAALQHETVRYLKNIFLHKPGHVLGFCHEFAPELEKDEECVQLGPRNPLSVMGYEFPPQIQTTDKGERRGFLHVP